MKDLAADLGTGISSALIPPCCGGCGVPGTWLCVACRDDCEPHALLVGRVPVRTAGAYEGALSRTVHRFKYREEPALAQELGGLVGLVVARDLASGIRLDAVVPVPLHPRRVRERGYDQTALLAAAIAASVALPVLSAVHRVRHARAQVELDRTARARNVDGAFVGVAGSLAGLRVALVDDVVTTGATLGAAARAARACGARSVRGYAVAYDE